MNTPYKNMLYWIKSKITFTNVITLILVIFYIVTAVYFFNKDTEDEKHAQCKVISDLTSKKVLWAKSLDSCVSYEDNQLVKYKFKNDTLEISK